MTSKSLYQQDYHSWLHHHQRLLKESRFAELDIENLIEELDAMSKKDERELLSRLIILLAHLLKWQYQPTMQSNSWLSSIVEQRAQLDLLFEDIPSLKNKLPDSLSKSYPKAVAIAVKETGLSVFPEECPYTGQQLLDGDFYP
jgi:hypothetical protein